MTDTPVQKFLQALYETTGKEARRNGKGWKASCPCPDHGKGRGDRNPSLAIGEAADGEALLECKAGCPTEHVVAAVGLTMRDLYPSTASTSTQFGKSQGKRQYRRRDNGKPKGKAYSTARAAVAALDSFIERKEQGRRVAQWTYRDADGKPVALIVRYDLPTPDGEKQDKTFRPVSKHADGWRLCGPPGKWPLYGLAGLDVAGRVYNVEGEKCAELARSIGQTATTSAHGAKSVHKTDWTPLAGCECVILRDADEAGGKYADNVAAIVGGLTATAAKVVELPGLQNEGDDIEQFIDARRNAGLANEQIRAEIEALADAAEPVEPIKATGGIDRYQPFPTDALPQPIRGFVEAGAKAIGCDLAYVALPLLTALAAAIGNKRRLQLKRGWFAPAILWSAIVGESGTAKTPAFKLAMRPMRERQGKAIKRYMDAMSEYQIEVVRHAVELEKWKATQKKSGDAGEPPEKPEEPQAERCIVSDTTVEALAPLLLANPRGLLLQRDELAGWIGSFDRYSGGKGGADAAHWLSMHNGESIIVDRKTGNQRTIFVPCASVSVTGGIQPGILNKALGSEHRESGLAARLLLACPPRRPKQWTEADIDPAAEREIARLIDRLYELQPSIDDDDEPRPINVGLTPDAKRHWTAYYDAHGLEQIDLSGELSAAWSKLEEYAARLALVVHLIRWAACDPTLKTPDAVDGESMAAGITLAQWFKHEARRVYAILSESDGDGEQRRLVEWIERKGNWIDGKGYAVTARQAQQGCRWLATSDDARAALDELAKAGCGHWEPTPAGQRGQPTQRFILSAPSAVYGNASNPDENGNSVDVDGVDDNERGWL